MACRCSVPQIAPLPGVSIAMEGQYTQTKWVYKNLFQSIAATLKIPGLVELSGAFIQRQQSEALRTTPMDPLAFAA